MNFQAKVSGNNAKESIVANFKQSVLTNAENIVANENSSNLTVNERVLQLDGNVISDDPPDEDDLPDEDDDLDDNDDPGDENDLPDEDVLPDEDDPPDEDNVADNDDPPNVDNLPVEGEIPDEDDTPDDDSGDNEDPVDDSSGNEQTECIRPHTIALRPGIIALIVLVFLFVLILVGFGAYQLGKYRGFNSVNDKIILDETLSPEYVIPRIKSVSNFNNRVLVDP